MKFILALLPTILLISYSQLITKWRVSEMAARQAEQAAPFARLAAYLTDPFIISAYVFSLLSSIAWLYVVEKYPVSTAFPVYIGILFAVVLAGSAVFLHEPLNLKHLAGVLLIVAGVVVASHA